MNEWVDAWMTEKNKNYKVNLLNIKLTRSYKGKLDI